MSAADIRGTVFKNGSAVLMARVVGSANQALEQADVTAVEYSVYRIDDQQPDKREAVEGHAAAALDTAEVVYDSLQTDGWSQDDEGYNFRHEIDVWQHVAFAVAGQKYLVEYTLSPASGQPILVRFRLSCI